MFLKGTVMVNVVVQCKFHGLGVCASFALPLTN